ncbi:MAG: T9SS type A sorting domain-containing protein, partial [Cyclobacteriaceae bacterium]|nr:T9SS type A sorting domain-containing protein [Cyclobacteriaceae bacterium]
FIFILAFSQAQTLEVRESVTFSGNIGKNIEGTISIKNTSERTIEVMVKRVEMIIGSSQKSWFCLGVECFEETQTESPYTFKIEPGQTINTLKTVLTSGISEGFSTVRYLIYEKGNPANEVEIEVNYTVENKVNENILFSSRDITINDVYPNPVSEFAIINYTISNPEKEMKIVIHSVLGSVLAEYLLQPVETNIKIKTEGYNPGVYFYTLYIDNEGLMTRKLIIQN